MWQLGNAVLALALGVFVCALPCGCGAVTGRTGTQPSAGAGVAEAVTPRAVASAIPAEADPLLARVKALAARRASSASRPSETPAMAARSLPGSGGLSRSAGLSTGTASSNVVADLLPRLRTGAASTHPRNEGGALAFVLGAGDEIDLVVSGQPEFSGVITVRVDGTVALPTTGDIVRAGGLSAAEFAAAVADALSPRYVKTRPALSAVVRRSPRLAYYVFGAVRRPGRYEMPPAGVTVLDALMRANAAPRATADFFNAPRASLEFVPVDGAVYVRVRVVAPGLGGNAVRIVDVARAMRGGAEALDRVRAGEIVIVPAAGGEWGEERLDRAIRLEGSRVTGPVAPGEEATP